MLEVYKINNKLYIIEETVADSRGGGRPTPLLTGCILKQVKSLHENALFCIKISKIFWG